MKRFLSNFAASFAAGLLFFGLLYGAGWLLFCFADLAWFNPFAHPFGRLLAGMIVIAAAWLATGDAIKAVRP